MKQFVNTQKIINLHKKAVRYMENAGEILRTKAKKRNEFYRDSKYVSMACGTAYKGVLPALVKSKVITKMWMITDKP